MSILPFFNDTATTEIYTFLLLKELEDAPEAGAAQYAEYGAYDWLGNEQRGAEESYTKDGKDPPALRAKVIFCFYHYGVECSYYEKGGYGYY